MKNERENDGNRETPQKAINKFDTRAGKLGETTGKWCQYIARFIAKLSLVTRASSLHTYGAAVRVYVCVCVRIYTRTGVENFAKTRRARETF